LLIEVPKDIEQTHPYLQKDVIAKIKKQVNEQVVFNQYDFQAVLYKEKIKGNFKYHYMIKKPIIHRYSDALITIILSRIESNPKYLENVRKQYRNRKK